MRKIYLRERNGNLLFLLFVLSSLYLSIVYKKENIHIYYLIAIIIAVFGIFFQNFNKALGFSINKLFNKRLTLFLLTSIIISNLLLILLYKIYDDRGIPSNQNHLIIGFVFFNSVRIFGEELIFRGFLLTNYIKRKKKLFWILNIFQAFLFGFIHTYATNGLASKISLGIYAFLLSVYFGWLNNKFNSFLPSWIIHWMNGLQTLLYAYGLI